MIDRAIFLDRDGTLVHPLLYPSRPEQLRLYDGVADELRTLQRSDWKLVIVTNQSGIARGYFDERALDHMHAHLAARLSAFGVDIDGFYFCPHHPDGTVPAFAVACECRKPHPGLLRRASDELDLDLTRCWLVGDILDDVEAGRRAGCRTVLVDLDTEDAPEHQLRTPHFVGRDTLHALRIIQRIVHGRPMVETDYRPARWGPLVARPREYFGAYGDTR